MEEWSTHRERMAARRIKQLAALPGFTAVRGKESSKLVFAWTMRNPGKVLPQSPGQTTDRKRHLSLFREHDRRARLVPAIKVAPKRSHKKKVVAA